MFCPGVFCPGGFCPGGFVRGVFVQGVFVRGFMSGGFLSGGFCPRTQIDNCFRNRVNRCPSVCLPKVISWHAFVSHLGMFSEIK